MKQKFKRNLLALLAALGTLLLAGCGADVSTEMTLDQYFSGQRVIQVELDANDLSHTTGGLAALAAVAEDNLPDQLSFESEISDEGGVLSFTLDFSDLEDYRAKVGALLEETNIDPDIQYSFQKNEFRHEIALTENFTSADLLDWYCDALEEAELVSESRYNWYESGETRVLLDGEEYHQHSTISLNDVGGSPLDAVTVTTILNEEGGYTRSIQLEANKSTREDLAAKGVELEEYMNGLCAEGVTLTAEGEEDRSYTFSFTTEDTDTLTDLTDHILKTSGNSFQTTLEQMEPGVLRLDTVQEIDASYYVSFRDQYGRSRYPVTCVLVPYDGCESLGGALIPANLQGEDGEVLSSFRAKPDKGQQLEHSFRWKVGFSQPRLSLKADKEKAEVQLQLLLPAGMPAEASAAAHEALTAAAEGVAELTVNTDEEGSVYTAQFQRDTHSAVSAAVSDLLGRFDGTGNGTFQLTTEEMPSSSSFVSRYSVALYSDLSPLTHQGVLLTLTKPVLTKMEPIGPIEGAEPSEEPLSWYYLYPDYCHIRLTQAAPAWGAIAKLVLAVAAALVLLALLLRRRKAPGPDSAAPVSETVFTADPVNEDEFI